jgi:hypothetical protein
MRCLVCKRYSPSHDISALQWETQDDKPVAESIIWRCRNCQTEFSEDSAYDLNRDGKYIHKAPEVKNHLGFQWGALACPRGIAWVDIAAAQMKAGKTGTREDQMLLDNSFRGMPWRQRKVNKDQVRQLEAHKADLPEPEIIVNRFMFADTQDNGWFWVVRGIDSSFNTYKLDNGFVRSEDELDSVWMNEYLGGVCSHGIIDAGGHADRPRVVKQFVMERQGLFMYKGNSRIGTTWKYAKEQERYGNMPKSKSVIYWLTLITTRLSYCI